MKKYLLILICLPAILFTACKKELSDNFITYSNHPLNDTAWVKHFSTTGSINDFFDLIQPNKLLIDSFNAKTGGTVSFGDSISLTFPPNALLTQAGTGLPSDMVKLIVLPLRKKGDFVKFFKPTTTADGSILETGGGLYVRAFCGDNEVTLAPGVRVKIRFTDVDIPKPNMQAFYGKESIPFLVKGIDTANSWFRDSDTSYLPLWSTPTNNPPTTIYYGYELNAMNLRWMSAERYIDSSLPKVKVTAILPPNFTNKNTAVFAVFTNQKTVVNLNGDYPSRSFFANKIPLKTAMKLISFSKIGGEFYIGVTNISSVEAVTSYKILPEKESFQDLLEYLNSL